MGKASMEVGEDGVAVIAFTNPPLNLLSLDLILDSFKEKYEQALQRDDVKAIVITGSNGKFSGGFDVSTFSGGRKREEPKPGYVSIDVLTDTFEAAKKPSVAAIDGVAFGGALELAMICHARISTSTAQLGLPELQFGLIPGLGGTQRLPRLVGLSKALEMILTSRPIKADEAHVLGLVDGISPPNELVMTARQWALDIAEHGRPWIASIYRNDKLEPLGKARKILKFARYRAKKQAPNLQHPLLCIDAIEEGIVSGSRAGLTKIPRITDLGLVPRRINKVAIAGGGLMGSGIATALILSNYPVILKEVDKKFLEAAIGRIKANLQSRVQKGKMTEEKFNRALSLLTGVLDYDSFRDVDMVIEAVNENVSLKQQIFADLEEYCPPHCILASNTSTIDIHLIGENTKSHDRIVGAHFFSPAHVMPLLEIIRTQRTSPQVIVDLLDVGKKINKTPIVVGNCTGFAVSRMFFPFSQSAFLLVDNGLDVYQIDRAISEFGMPMGPFRTIDLIGFGVVVAIAVLFSESFPRICYKSALIPVLLEDKRAGEATHKGFYLYDKRRKASPDPEMKKYIEKSRRIAGVTADPKLMNLPHKDIVEMILFPVVNEACRILAEGIALKASDLDIASVMGRGFPRYRGGVVFWADSLGSKYICSKMEAWARAYGDFYKPCPYLAERAAKGGLSLTAPVELVNSRL